MTKQTITTEIDIPDGYEFVQIDYIPFEVCRVVLRPIWQPPSWMRPGWIAMDENQDWYWHAVEPSQWDHIFSSRKHSCIIYRKGKPTVGDFTPPPCDDWKQSKRRIGGAE